MPVFADTVENFESGQVNLVSFPGEDQEPERWGLDTVITHNGSGYALKLSGNTWKVEPIAPLVLDSGELWEVWVYAESVGEIQGFGLVSATETLLYSFAGTERVDPGRWVTVYQGAFPLYRWNCYRLPVGEDWLSRFGHLATVDGIVFINDRDSGNQGTVYFDDVIDITADRPVAPQVRIWYERGAAVTNQDGTWSITVYFYSQVTDPDSREHFYRWLFGDDSTSSDSCPVHTYVVRDDHRYTVLLGVQDEDGLWGWDTCQVLVEPGPSGFPIRLNFVGDVMLARRYEPVIDTLGVEGIFRSIKPYLGDGADITVANLECPLTDQGSPHPTKPIVFRGRPANVRGLSYAGIDFVSLANNHIIDFRLEGLRQTQAVLDSAGILFSGAGGDAYEAYRPEFICRRGVNFALLGYSDRTGQYDNYQPYLNAGYNKPGFADLDTFRVFQKINRVKGLSDRIIVQLHSGVEYQPVPADDEGYFPLAVRPTSNQIQLRRRIIDMGADLVVCHHPHILQGFEVYRGKLIAHSLGNFAFDQEYPETYPSVILNGLVDDQGFYRYWLVPVYIDDYIPRRASGELGVNILRYLARRSRELNTYLVVNRESVVGEVVLDSAGLQPQRRRYQADVVLMPDSVYWVSLPVRVGDAGDLSAVFAVIPGSGWQFRLGRELVWFGNMEDEGATLWSLNQLDEFYDTVAVRGDRSLCQRRTAGSGAIITNFEERMVLGDSQRLGVYGWVKGENAFDARVILNLYNSRVGGTRVGVCSLPAVNGSGDWRLLYGELGPDAGFFDLWLRSAGPESGNARVWFDDLGVIEWEEWQDLANPVAVGVPNDYRWVQVRNRYGQSVAVVSYEETDYRPLVGEMERGDESARGIFLSVQPNPVRGEVLIVSNLPVKAMAKMSIFNAAGQLVRRWTEGGGKSGRRIFVWDRRDGQGRRVAAGTYFCRLVTDTGTVTARVVLLPR